MSPLKTREKIPQHFFRDAGFFKLSSAKEFPLSGGARRRRNGRRSVDDLTRGT